MAVVCIVLSGVLGRAPIASGQDQEDRLLPREIENADLALYGRLLNLSEAQKAAVGEMYVEYLKHFDALKRDVIEPLGQLLEPARTYAGHLLDLERRAREVEEARDRIRRVDGELFTQIQAILDEAQAMNMGRVRDHRERRTLRVLTILWQTGRRFHDATTFAYDLDLSVEDRELLDPILAAYERQLTSRLGELHDANRVWEIAPMREFVRRGLGGTPIGESGIDYREVVGEVWRTAGVRCLEVARGIDDLNESTSRRVVEILSRDGGHLWLDEYLPRAFEDTVWTRTRRRSLLNAFARTRGMTPEDERRFAQAFAQFEMRLNAIEREFIELDRAYRPRRSLFYADDDGMSSDDYIAIREGKITALKRDIEQFSEVLRGTLRPVIFDQWQSNFLDATRPTFVATTHPGGEAILSVYDAPLFMDRRDLERIVRTLELDDDARTAIDEAFAGYQASQKGIEHDLPSQEPNEFSDIPPLTDELRARIQRLDSDLFGAIDRLCPDDECRRRLRWLANARQRKLLAHGASAGMADAIDAAVFILDSHLGPDENRRLGDLLDSYDAEAAPLFKRLYNARRLEHEGELASPDGRVSFQLINARRECHRAIARLNVQSIRAADELLDSPSSNAMLTTFNRHCFYFIMVDDGRLDTAFRRVALLDDLTNDQRGRLLDLKVSYEDAYDRLTDRMLDLVKDSVFWHGGDRWAVPEGPRGENREDAYNSLMFKRIELNAATNLKIMSILTPAQLDAIGGLPELK